MANIKVAPCTPYYRPGEKVPHSGVYRVDHMTGHRIPHEVTAIAGKRFPRCRKCNGGAAFVLVHAAQNVDEHEDFSGHS